MTKVMTQELLIRILENEGTSVAGMGQYSFKVGTMSAVCIMH